MSTCGDPGREWATAVIQMEEQQLDWIVANLSLVGGAVES